MTSLAHDTCLRFGMLLCLLGTVTAAFNCSQASSAGGAGTSCASDRDCKNNRICESSLCVDPPFHGHIHRPILASGPTAAPAGAHLTYMGGPVISSVAVQLVFWKSTVNYQADLRAFYTTIAPSSYLSWLSEYNTPSQQVGAGSYLGAYVDTDAPSSVSLKDIDIQDELRRLIDTAAIAPPGGNTLYAVHLPPGIRVSLPGLPCGNCQSCPCESCDAFCGYHGATYYGSGDLLWYFVVPDLTSLGCENRCGSGTALQNTTSVGSHELVESITDPAATFPGTSNLAWYDANIVINGTQGAEIGDLCNGQHVAYAGYTVQAEFSNELSDCIATKGQAGGGGSAGAAGSGGASGSGGAAGSGGNTGGASGSVGSAGCGFDAAGKKLPDGNYCASNSAIAACMYKGNPADLVLLSGTSVAFKAACPNGCVVKPLGQADVCAAFCGDSSCGGGETCSSCPQDCSCSPKCGDGKCDAPESCSTCPQDCGGPCSNACGGKCGDGACTQQETCSTCPADCPCGNACGDGVCDGTESCSLPPHACFSDCCLCAPALSAPADGLAQTSGASVAFSWASVPGAVRYELAICMDPGMKTGCIVDDKIAPSQTTVNETIPTAGVYYWSVAGISASEAKDGWSPYHVPGYKLVATNPSCGNGKCDSGETCASCSADCGPCPAPCGDGKCSGAETCASCPADCPPCAPACGDSVCNVTETCSSCPQDCGSCQPMCGDTKCNGTENCSSCPSDCGSCPPSCGDSKCNNGETCLTCSQDCGACPPSCGDGSCNGVETCSSCPNDCGACSPICGDTKCNGTETCSTCSQDCGTCPPKCGDATCNGTDTCVTCPNDCGTCPPACGDAKCNGTETCSSCVQDCGACPPSCGDGSCNGVETCSSCPNDCGACPPSCGDAMCNGTESCSTCSQDCGACPPICGDGMCGGSETCSTCPQDCGTCSCDVAVAQGQRACVDSFGRYFFNVAHTIYLGAPIPDADVKQGKWEIRMWFDWMNVPGYVGVNAAHLVLQYFSPGVAFAQLPGNLPFGLCPQMSGSRHHPFRLSAPYLVGTENYAWGDSGSLDAANWQVGLVALDLPEQNGAPQHYLTPAVGLYPNASIWSPVATLAKANMDGAQDLCSP